MSHQLSRRSFIKSTAVTAAAAYGASALTMSAKSYGAVVGSNDDITVGVIGFNGRGNSHISAYTNMKGVRVIALSDCDEKVLNKGVEKLNSQGTKKPTTKPVAAAASVKGGNGADEVEAKPQKAGQVKGYVDLRKLLDNKDIDAITTATPNHWHSLIAIWACQAGKDAYIEKPVSHNVWEGRQAVEAAKKYNRIVATGTQSRSRTALKEAYEWLHKGGLGKIQVARGFCYKRRASIGNSGTPVKVPEGVDWNLWAGPSSDKLPKREKFHYDWHWFWETGNGDIGNQGIHEMDKCRWALGKDHLAPRVLSIGGRFGYKDDGETPNTQIAIHDYGDCQLIFEVRGLEAKPKIGRMDNYKGQSVGQVIECEGGYLADATAYDWEGKKIKDFKGGEDHFGNFIKAVQSRKVSDLNSDILEGHLSSALCHTGNISHQLGKTAAPGEIESIIKSNKAAMDSWTRFQEHLGKHDICCVTTEATLGAYLEMDPKTERFTNNDKANALLTRQYRAPFVVPEKV